MARTTPSAQDALTEYLLTRTHCAPNTQLNDASVLWIFVRYLGGIQIGHVTAQHVERYFFQGPPKDHLPSSYNKARQRVEGFLKFCETRGWVRRSLLHNVARRRVVQRDRLRISPSQMLDLLETTPCPRDRCMLAVGINLALRASEITSLRVGDVNLANGDLHVVISKSALEDHMPISAELDVELRRWLTIYAEDVRVQRHQALKAEDFLFPSREPSRIVWTGKSTQARMPGPWRPGIRMTHPARVVQLGLARIGVQIGAGEGFHTLRRSAGRAFFDAVSNEGHDHALRMTMSFLHHKSSATTELYLGLRHEQVKRDEMLRGKPFLSRLVAGGEVVRLRPVGDPARQD